LFSVTTFKYLSTSIHHKNPTVAMKVLALALSVASLFSGVMALEGRCTPGNSYCGSVLISRGM